MDTLEKIEAELNQISKWPWRANHLSVFNGPGLHDVLLSADNTYQADDYSNFTEHDAEFIAHAPERIAALVEYARAAERYIYGGNGEGVVEWRKARAKLGLK